MSDLPTLLTDTMKTDFTLSGSTSLFMPKHVAIAPGPCKQASCITTHFPGIFHCVILHVNVGQFLQFPLLFCLFVTAWRKGHTTTSTHKQKSCVLLEPCCRHLGFLLCLRPGVCRFLMTLLVWVIQSLVVIQNS